MTDLRHFGFLAPSEMDGLFSVAPSPFARDAQRHILAGSLGATLYSPATRDDLISDLTKARAHGVISSVVCLEDSISDGEVAAAVEHVIDQLDRLHVRVEETPLVFVRVRNADQITEIVDRLGDRTDALAGFVVPKFSANHGQLMLDRVREASKRIGRRLWAMPVIETADVAHRETRTRSLLAIGQVLARNRDLTLAVRIGATDLAGVYGLRRPKELTIYDLRVVADAIADIVNVFGRSGDRDWVISGAVWEYFGGSERIFKPQLRESPFGIEERALRAGLIAAELDGLIREVVLDRANGLVGKSVIHPMHVPVVHSLCVVSSEDYSDALAVLGHGMSGGVLRSEYGNKMNESGPHRAWAHATLRRAEAFGVTHDEVSFVDMIAAALRA